MKRPALAQVRPFGTAQPGELITFTVPGKPQPKQRPRFSGRSRSVYTPKETADYESKVKFYAMQARVPFFEGDVRLSVTLYFPDKRHPDGDNALKSQMDALQGLAFANDKQVKEGRWRIDFDSANPRAVVALMVLEER